MDKISPRELDLFLLDFQQSVLCPMNHMIPKGLRKILLIHPSLWIMDLRKNETQDF